jgi:hypothetical protein
MVPIETPSLATLAGSPTAIAPLAAAGFGQNPAMSNEATMAMRTRSIFSPLKIDAAG